MIRSNSIHGSRIHRTILFATLVCLIVGSATIAQAESLGLNPTGSPDITTFYGTTDYNAGTGLFTATAYSWCAMLDNVNNICNYDSDGNDLPVFGISMNVNGDGVPTSGALSVNGYFYDPDSGNSYLGISESTTLLTGTIDKFGFSGSGESAELEFVFNVTGGALQSAGVYPAQVGVLFHQSGYTDWTHDFSANVAFSDMFNVSSVPIPEPSGWALLSSLAVGGGLSFGWRSFSRRIRRFARKVR